MKLFHLETVLGFNYSHISGRLELSAFTVGQYAGAGRQSPRRLPWVPYNLCHVGQRPILELGTFILAAPPWMCEKQHVKRSPRKCKSKFM